MRKEWLIAVVMLVSGCATKPPRLDQLREPPPDRLLGLQERHASDGVITVTRDVGYAGSACYAAVFIEGAMVAKLGTGERASFFVPPGQHIIGTWNTGSGLCGYREGRDRKETSVVVASHEEKRFRITINPNSGVEINPTTL